MDLNPTSPAIPPSPARAERLMDVAQSVEAQFLSEMLKSAGIGQTPEAFGGGSGEDQFSSFLRDEHAKQMTQAGGIGLAQALFDSMVAKSHE
ncbi:rod-binding protein [Octadecabacter sp. G9-8]|uniref:Rod-binding protein n=1 Tax=Octadecabacter dasysiphoniae TaxID=2909341 RepID=A0ABS9CZ07_9RHOB|nr:rod-binding protein [Octadecabacter dasysiphoniae]MCF2871619.1 rod-binding protein [Octadecabacter dasysiphoniae]